MEVDQKALKTKGCARCGADLAEFPLFIVSDSGGVTGPYCDPCATSVSAPETAPQTRERAQR
jgi:hypothetical protein